MRRLLAIAAASFLTIQTADSSVRVVVEAHEKGGALASVFFCSDCDDPRDGGSRASALLSAKRTERRFRVEGTLLYGVPNDAREPLLRPERAAAGGGADPSSSPTASEPWARWIAFVDRGAVPLAVKARHAQAAGASAVLIADLPAGRDVCDARLDCGAAGSLRAGGFAVADEDAAWEGVTIPSLLVTASAAQRLRQLMRLTRADVGRFGPQYTTTQATPTLHSAARRPRERTTVWSSNGERHPPRAGGGAW